VKLVFFNIDETLEDLLKEIKKEGEIGEIDTIDLPF